MKKLVSMMALAAILFSMNAYAQQQKPKDKAKKECTATEKKACKKDKKSCSVAEKKACLKDKTEACIKKC